MPRPPLTPTLFPYTTLFRSGQSGFRRGLTALAFPAALPLQRPTERQSRESPHEPRQPPVRFRSHAARLENLGGMREPDLGRSEEHTSELQSRQYLVCRLLLE